jgi:hypothetical protein
MSVLFCLEWLGLSEVDFAPSGMAWNRGSRFWHDWNGLERRNLVLALPEWLGMEEVGFVQPDVMAWTLGR